MIQDPRAQVAKFYDLDHETPDDIPFYQSRIRHKDTHVLELGCGTGRVTVPLSRFCSFIHGIELSEAMLSICRAKLVQAEIPASKIQVEHGDITDFGLGRKFGLIIAPYRVLQNLETDREVDGLFRCVRDHLAVGGSCILNVFNPRYPDSETLIRAWCTNEEALDWHIVNDDLNITCHCRKGKLDPEKLVLYPDLIYRVHKGGILSEETVFNLVMRCYFPADFENLIVDHGFEIVERWGGYSGEAYGCGSELVIEFRRSA